MNDKTKNPEKSKARVVLGPNAKEITAPFLVGDAEASQADLERAIADLIEGKNRAENELVAARQVRHADVTMERITKLVQKETDQLHHETDSKLERQHAETVNMFNALRHLIEVVASDLTEEDTVAAVKEVNLWLDKAIKPIAETRAEVAKNRRGDGRLPEEDDPTQMTTNHAEVTQTMREQEPDMFQDRGTEMER